MGRIGLAGFGSQKDRGWEDDGLDPGQPGPSSSCNATHSSRLSRSFSFHASSGTRVGWSKRYEDGVLNVQWTPDGPLEPLP